MVQDDYDAAHRERQIFDHELPCQREHRKAGVKHNLRRSHENSKSPDEVQNKHGVCCFREDVTNERETDKRFKSAQEQITDTVGKNGEARVHDIVDGVKARQFERPEPEENNANRDARKRDTVFKHFFAVHNSPTGNRTPILPVKGACPEPLDDRAENTNHEV